MNKVFAVLLVCLLAFSMTTLFIQVPEAQAQSKTFGNTALPTVNWNAFWAKFNAVSDWDLEYYDGSTWKSVKSDLTATRNYPEENYCKITLNFTASHAANYRLTFAIDLPVLKYVNKEAQYQYSLDYGDYSVFFDWSDAQNISGLVFSHGVLDGKFWFRMRRDNVPLGAHVVIDPTFGYSSIGSTGAGVSNVIRGSVFTMPEYGSVTSITAALRATEFYYSPPDNFDVKATIYYHGNLSLVATSSETEVSLGEGFQWVQMDFASPVALVGSVDYILTVDASLAGSDPMAYVCLAYDAGATNQGHYQVSTYPTFPDPLVPVHDNNKYSVYATYTPTSPPAGNVNCIVASSPEINSRFSVNGTSYNTPQNVSVSDSDTSSFTAEHAKIYGENGYLFVRWLVNGTDSYYTETVNFVVTGETTLTVYYTEYSGFYLLYGPFDEETGVLLNENVTVTAYYSVTGYGNDTFEFNGTSVFSPDTTVQFFQFNFSDGKTREYWVDPSEGVTPIYIFKGDTTKYTINFLDTTGTLNSYPYVTIKRYVNGTLFTVEKRKVDAYGSILANLIETRTYQIILGNEETTYVFGDFLATYLTAVQLTIRGVDFPKETLFLQKYLRIYGYRNVTGGYLDYLVVNYEDTKEDTASVDIYIYHGDGILVYSTNIASDSFSLEWYGAAHSVSYQLTAIIHHNEYGDVTWKQYFVGGNSVAPFSLAFLGNWEFDSTFLIPALLILCVAGCFSAVNAYLGAVLMSITAIILAWMGWFPVPAGMLVAAICFSIMLALVYTRRNVAVGY